MSAGPKELTDPPTNLKEAVDWLALVGSDKGWGWQGKRMYEDLEEALKQLPGFDKTAYYNKRFNTDRLSNYISRSAQALSTGFLGYTSPNSGTPSGSGIVKNGYRSSYHNASWVQSDEHIYANIFLFLAPLVYYFITFLYWMCKTNGKWAGEHLSRNGPFHQFLTDMGFPSNLLNRNKQGSEIAKHLDGTQGSDASPELKGAYEADGTTSYNDFLRNLKKNDYSKRPEYPLANCKICSYEYLQSRHSGADVTAAIDKIRAELVRLSKNRNISYSSNFSALQQKVQNLLGTSKSFDPNAVPSPVAPVAPLAGTLTTLAAAGGAGAAYGLNLGDCPSNLKEAIDWILRVTGRDGGTGGGTGSGNETILAQAVANLPDFNEAIKAAEDKLKESGNNGVNVSQALANIKESTTLSNIIGKLADGLRTFIGYGGGKGIADLVDPLQQLRKGVLMFLQMMLYKLKSAYTYNGATNTTITSALSKAIKGGDSATFDSAIGKVGQLQENNGPGSGSQVKEVVSAVKNVTNLKGKNGVDQLAQGFKEYLTEVLSAVKSKVNGQASPHVRRLCSELQTLMDKVGKNQSDLDSLIKNIKNANNTLNSKRNGDYIAKALIPAVASGIPYLLTQLNTEGYKSSYQPTSTWTTDFNNQGNGGWENMAFNGSGGFALKHFLVGEGYNGSYLTTTRGFKGSDIVNLIGSLDQFSNVSSSPNPSHTDMLTELDNSLKEVIGSSGPITSASFNDHSLSALFYLCRCYFTGKQIINPVTERRPPTSIREMLYWLSGLQFSPNYSDLEKQIDNVIPAQHGLPVADSAIPASTAKSTGDTLTRDQMKGFLLSSCLSAPGVLGAIQGNSADTDGEPWLYSLFCNSMNLQYPSGSALFNTLSNYAYALQFQLSFLYMQCVNGASDGFGWNQCTFGQTINTQNAGSAANVSSWICSSSACVKSNHCQHNSSSCTHFQQCGQTDKSSPL
ncbi:variant erythrocyte surface antigen-1 family protein [Babesia caballi]|uniref:Variant erythrocyte surface antigen-1 family protein n=1 Tax=Babesia caballi TaxID=5871 RepID=A0AAV4LRY0_BABCB|nr:variant erythrocyte surface antigen-1 family protein [Babesia caballi]